MSRLISSYFEDTSKLSKELEGKSAEERIAFLGEEFDGKVIVSTSAGLQAAVMLHLVKKHSPNIPIIFIDTGYLFGETYQYLETLKERFKLDVKIFNSKITPARQEALYGKLWEQGGEGLNRYAAFNKIEPMNRALLEHDAKIWISGLRRSHSSTRKNRAFAEKQSQTIKVYPILDWSDEDVAAYFRKFSLPRHPLEGEGYVTMGDWHSTKKLEDAQDAESTRFGGEKYECGLHMNSEDQDYQI